MLRQKCQSRLLSNFGFEGTMCDNIGVVRFSVRGVNGVAHFFVLRFETPPCPEILFGDVAKWMLKEIRLSIF